MVKQIRFYLLISKDPPKHTHLYGPLQSLSYGGVWLMIFLIVVTGVILIGASNPGLMNFFRPTVKPIVNPRTGAVLTAAEVFDGAFGPDAVPLLRSTETGPAEV